MPRGWILELEKKKCLSAEKMLFFRYEFLPFERKLVKRRFEEKKCLATVVQVLKRSAFF